MHTAISTAKSVPEPAEVRPHGRARSSERTVYMLRPATPPLRASLRPPAPMRVPAAAPRPPAGLAIAPDTAVDIVGATPVASPARAPIWPPIAAGPAYAEPPAEGRTPIIITAIIDDHGCRRLRRIAARIAGEPDVTRGNPAISATIPNPAPAIAARTGIHPCPGRDRRQTREMSARPRPDIDRSGNHRRCGRSNRRNENSGSQKCIINYSTSDTLDY